MGAFTVIISVRDAKGKTASTEFNFPSDYVFGDVALFAAQQAQRINKLIRGAITSISVAKAIDVPNDVRVTPLSDSDVEEGARFQFQTEGGFYTSTRLPTFDEAKLVTGSREVNLTDGDVVDYVDSMVTGAPVVALGGVLDPSDKRDEDIVALTSAREMFQSSRKG